jgi:ribosomal protein L28
MLRSGIAMEQKPIPGVKHVFGIEIPHRRRKTKRVRNPDWTCDDGVVKPIPRPLDVLVGNRKVRALAERTNRQPMIE